MTTILVAFGLFVISFLAGYFQSIYLNENIPRTSLYQYRLTDKRYYKMVAKYNKKLKKLKNW